MKLNQVKNLNLQNTSSPPKLLSPTTQNFEKTPATLICLNSVEPKKASQQFYKLDFWDTFLFFSNISSNTVDMTLEVSVVDKFGEDILHKCRYGATIKAEPFIKLFNEMVG